MKPIDVLMVEDNPGDVVLLREALSSAGINYHINVMRDGVEAMEYLRGQGEHAGATRPALIILDLKLPRKSGREVLAEIAVDARLLAIPLVIFSSSRSELALARSPTLPRRAYLVKPSTFAGYVKLTGTIEAFRQGTEIAGKPEVGHEC